MALLVFAQTRRDRVTLPATIHCDHLIPAHVGVTADLPEALQDNAEVYTFLQSAAARWGMGFWGPGSGIIHQVVLEHYAFPGGLLLGTDSHTPNAGGLGMFAVGVGGQDACEVLAGMDWTLLYPRRIGVRLTGHLDGWASPKDVILDLPGQLSVRGGTHSVFEFFGPGTSSISATGKATITNMGAETGATSSFFPFDDAMARYLRATERADLADLAEKSRDLITADPEIEAYPDRFFDRVLELDLSELEPYVVGPGSPDRARPLSKFKEEVHR